MSDPSGIPELSGTPMTATELAPGVTGTDFSSSPDRFATGYDALGNACAPPEATGSPS
ncbi:hypothetical protein [Rhodococcus sp. SJ-3]|uniref:hypothetical protein n=1 Tax=Rhodococcus sp. SJ-3 TaxID=3454628 RepID=UPI003F799A35